MLQIDPFWSYGIGAGCALATAARLRDAHGDGTRREAIRDRGLLATLLFMGMLFIPMGMWLATRFPGWETMYAWRAVPPWALAAFSAGLVVCATAGYLLTHRLLVRGKPWGACLQFVAAYVFVFCTLIHGWDGTGLRRFLATAPAAFTSPTPTTAELIQWLRSPIAETLFWMGLVLIPALLAVNVRLRTGGTGAPGTRGAPLDGLDMVLRATMVILGPCLALAVSASLAVTVFGPLLGGAAWTALAVAVLHPRSALAAVCRRIVLPAACPPRRAEPSAGGQHLHAGQ
ncbi:hypothetical protein DMA15_11555 [Streptomyces sp. WAC 01529]|uniref:hypothetical protein n=1 Tax=Streptomyces sp. WAC 01529 TaxID=2203205 RepID=UPI000F6D7391|nr:hypothetical protein [Streptomyces sp. WAC 01529]AZM53151.1 hypothetical protein DMA15_11555 [Streptomyces sp. WAC 01529]